MHSFILCIHPIVSGILQVNCVGHGTFFILGQKVNHAMLNNEQNVTAMTHQRKIMVLQYITL